MFSKASWLERIHHNGGQPIYADAPKDAARSARRAGVTRAACRHCRRTSPPPARCCRRSGPGACSPASRPPRRRAISRRCSPRPRLIARSRSTCSPRSGRCALTPLSQRAKAPSPSATPAPSPCSASPRKELRLHLALGEHPFDEIVKKGQAGRRTWQGRGALPHAGADRRTAGRCAFYGSASRAAAKAERLRAGPSNSPNSAAPCADIVWRHCHVRRRWLAHRQRSRLARGAVCIVDLRSTRRARSATASPI